jgi:cyclin G-associated kinase
MTRSGFLFFFLGGFAIVYVARDIQSGSDYALKRLFGSDKDECNNIIKEINIHKQVSGHPNIVKFITASFIDRTQNNGRAEYLLVTELCKGGSLYDCLDKPMDPPTVLKIMYQATKAVAHLHSQNINHRDIKVENFLIGTDGLLKLCDFGSATLESHSPDVTWSTQQRNNLEELLQKFTTPMYRAPEQLDTWNNYHIGVKTDVWALGCILYCLCYKKHPFEDGAKLRITNGNYTIPSDSRFACYADVIKGCFVVDPSSRFDVSMILERLGAISETLDWSLKGPIEVVGKPLDSPLNEGANIPSAIPNLQPSPAHVNAPARPPPPQAKQEIRQVPLHHHQQQQQQPQQIPQQAAAGGGLFSSIKGGAGSFLKNLKDTSSKVMQSVQQTMARTDLDISYITQRIIVMPCPTEGLESAYKTNHIEDVKMYMEQRYPPSKISVYNLGPRCARLPPPVRTVECGFIYQPNPPKAPSLTHMYSLAEDMYGFLISDPKTVVIIQSPDGGRATASTMVSALMIYAQLVREPEDALQMFAVKRIPPNMKPSELRYLYYAADIVRSHFPHYNPITLVSINFSPVPRMTKARDGCRLYIEVIANDRVVVSTAQEYDRMR